MKAAQRRLKTVVSGHHDTRFVAGYFILLKLAFGWIKVHEENNTYLVGANNNRVRRKADKPVNVRAEIDFYHLSRF